jgi:hypothetical protein
MSLKFRPFYLWGKQFLFPLNRKLDGPQNRSGLFGKDSSHLIRQSKILRPNKEWVKEHNEGPKQEVWLSNCHAFINSLIPFSFPIITPDIVSVSCDIHVEENLGFEAKSVFRWLSLYSVTACVCFVSNYDNLQRGHEKLDLVRSIA